MQLSDVFKVSPAEARERFKQYTRSASFSLSLGIREIRILATRPWDPDREWQSVDLQALQRLCDKGLVHTPEQQNVRPQPTEAGKLVRQLLVESGHVPLRDVSTNENGIMMLLTQCAANFASDWANGLILKRVENRTIDGDPTLILRINEGLGRYSEWAIPRSAIKRIG